MDKKTKDEQDKTLNTAIMFTDIVGYSRMMHADSSATIDFLRKHDALLAGEIYSHSGKVIKTIGDSFMAEFPLNQDALTCAISIQKHMESEFGSSKQIRIGLHSGEVIRKDNDIFGDSVNITSRLESQAPYGCISVSKEFLSKAEIPAGIKYENAGLMKLKNIKSPVEACRIYPTENVYKTEMKKRADKKRIKAISSAAIALLLASLIVSAVFLKPYFEFVVEKQKWVKWAGINAKSEEKLRKEWSNCFNLYIDTHDNGFLVQNRSMTSSRKKLPKQPFMADIDFHVWNEKESSVFIFAVSDMMKEIEPYFDEMNSRINTEWDGLFGLFEIQPGFAVIKAGTGNQTLKTENFSSRTVRFTSPANKHNLKIIYDRDILTAVLDYGKPVKMLVKKINKNKSPEFIFGFYGNNFVIRKGSVYARKLYKDLDLLTAADNYRMEGKTRQALDSYDELIRRAITAEDKCMYMYKKACALRDAGNIKDSESLLRSIISEKTNEYTYYSAFDLVENKLKTNLKLNDPEKLIFNIALSAPEDNPIRYPAQTLKLKQLLAGDDKSAAEEFARSIIYQDNAPNEKEAFKLLFSSIYSSKTSETQKKKSEMLDWIIKNRNKGNIEIYNNALLTKLEMLYEKKDANNFFKTAGRFFYDYEYLMMKNRGHFMTLLNKASVDKNFTAEQQRWRKELEKNRIKAIKSYKNFLRGLPVPAGTSREKYLSQSPLCVAASKYLTNNLKIKRGRPSGDGVFFKPQSVSIFPTGELLQEDPYIDNGILIYDYAPGKNWGCEVGISVNKTNNEAGNSVNMSGYSKIEIELNLPENTRWGLVLSESGHKRPQSKTFKGIRGADGESYFLQNMKSSGGWNKYIVPLNTLEPHLFWGNQHGNNTIDIQAVDLISISVVEKQPKGQMKIRSIKFIN